MEKIHKNQFDFNKKIDELTTSITAINTKLSSLSNINETSSPNYSSILKTHLNSPTIHNIRPTIHNSRHSVPTIYIIYQINSYHTF